MIARPGREIDDSIVLAVITILIWFGALFLS